MHSCIKEWKKKIHIICTQLIEHLPDVFLVQMTSVLAESLQSMGYYGFVRVFWYCVISKRGPGARTCTSSKIN